MKRIKVTAYFNIADEDYDAGPEGPLTANAFDEIIANELFTFGDLKFEVADG